jgi:NAD(P)-dependent dehydrogenase (short-subunit alcohol dehydrogenase family)
LGTAYACQRNFLRPFSRARDSAIGRAIALKLAADGFDVGITFNTGRDRAVAVAKQIESIGVRTIIASRLC